MKTRKKYHLPTWSNSPCCKSVKEENDDKKVENSENKIKTTNRIKNHMNQFSVGSKVFLLKFFFFDPFWMKSEKSFGKQNSPNSRVDCYLWD